MVGAAHFTCGNRHRRDGSDSDSQKEAEALAPSKITTPRVYHYLMERSSGAISPMKLPDLKDSRLSCRFSSCLPGSIRTYRVTG
jgi:hypothetical protein